MCPLVRQIYFLGWQTLLIMLFVPPLMAQQYRKIDTAAIYKKSAFAPRPLTKNPIHLAKHLTKGYRREGEKVLALSYWITQNIKYNYKAFKQRRFLQNNSIQVLQKRKALCNEYAQLFKEMCAAVGIQAAVVNGYTKGFDFFEVDDLHRAEHSWSIVRVNERWQLLDLTYGSGHIVPKKQPLVKLLANLFGRNYIPQFKYVHQFDPQWFNVTPDEFIFTHFPNLNQYQLLEIPLPFAVFKKGGWSIYEHLSWHYKMIPYTTSIDAYLEQSQIQQWLEEGEAGHHNNPTNYSVKGLNYYRAADCLFQKAWDRKNDRLKKYAKIDLKTLEAYINIADSCLQLSILGNQKELQAKEMQSLSWKQRLHANNKQHIDCLLLQRQKKAEQQQLVQQVEQGNELNQALVTQLIQEGKTSITSNASSIKASKATVDWLAKRDSLQKIATHSMHQKDSFMERINENKENLMALEETLVLKIYKGNARALKKLFRQKKQSLPLVYQRSDVLDKDWLLKSYQRADSINEKVTYLSLLALQKDQLASYQKIKQYYKAVTNELALVQKTKQSISQLKNKKATYSTLETELINYQQELKNCLGFQKKLVRLLAQEIKQIERSNKTLQADIVLEQDRHREYMHYRQFIQIAEDVRIKVLLQRLATIRKYIDKAKAN